MVLGKLFHSFWNQEVKLRIHKGSPIIPILFQINQIKLCIYSNIVLPFTPRPS